MGALVLAACGGFRPLGGDGGAGDAANVGADLAFPPGSDLAGLDLTVVTGPDLAVGGGNGPGPRGALPSGYCCTANDECRYRTCEVIAGSRMCADSCYGNSSCTGLVAGFHCTGMNGTPGRCEPAGATACIPAAQFRWGGKKIGACCDATGDARAGTECEGGRCISVGDVANPFVCTHPCTSGADCPGNWLCTVPPDGGKICIPLAAKYTCS